MRWPTLTRPWPRWRGRKNPVPRRCTICLRRRHIPKPKCRTFCIRCEPKHRWLHPKRWRCACGQPKDFGVGACDNCLKIENINRRK